MAKKKAPKPTREMILARAREMESHYRDQDEQIELMRECRELRMEVPLPEALQRIKSVSMKDPTIAEEIDRVVAALIAEPPKLILTPANAASGVDQTKATDIENWTMQALIEADNKVLGQSVYEMMTDAAIGDGGAWIKILYDAHRWESVWNVPTTESYLANKATGDELTEEDMDATPASLVVKQERDKSARQYLNDREAAKKGSGIPIRRTVVDARCVYPVYAGTDLIEMLEISERPAYEVLARYGLSGSDVPQGARIYGHPVSEEEARQYPTTCKHYEHWTKEYVTYFMEMGGEYVDLDQIRHNYSQVPYFPAFGRMKNYARGRKVGDGIGQTRLQLIRYRQFFWDLVVNIAVQSAGTPIKHTTPDVAEPLEGDTDKPTDEVQLWQLNGIYDVRPGENFEPLQLPGVPDPIRDFLQILNAMIDRVGIPRLNTNIGGGLEGAGYAVAQILTEIRTALNPYVIHMQESYVHQTRFFWKLLRDHLPDEKIYVLYTPEKSRSQAAASEWLAVTPSKDLTDSFGIRWEINPEPPTASIVKARYWTELLNAKLAYPDEVVEALGRNPSDVRRGILAEQFRNEGVVKDYQLQVFMERMRMGDLIRKAAKQMAQQGNMPGGMPGMPEMPGGFGAPLGMVAGGPAPGAPIMPDPGMLAMTPGGAGAAPQLVGGLPGGPTAPGQGVPPQTMQAAVQSIGR